MQQGQTPYQRILTSRQAGTPASAPVQNRNVPPPPAVSPPPVENNSSPSESKSLFKKIFGVLGRLKRNEDEADSGVASVDKDTGRRMAYVALGFLVFYVILMWAILQNDYNSGQATAQSDHLQWSVKEAQRISGQIESSIISINTGMNEGDTPAKAARLIAKSPNLDASVILNSRKEIVGAYPENSEYLKDVSIANMAANSVKIDSIIQQDGTVIPVLVKKTGSYYTIAAVKRASFLKTNRSRLTSLVAPSGRVIAGNKVIGLHGPMEVYGLDTAKLKSLTQPGKQMVDMLEINGSKTQFVSVEVPNSNLFLFEAIPATVPALFKKSLILFSVLFLGITTLIWLLLKQLFKQMHSMRKILNNSEISQQRFRAAVEGDRGGVWEIDLVNNIAYLSASLAALLGLPRSEHEMQMSQFLGLFHPQDREKFLSFARRAHIQGEFDFDMNVAHLPLILQCRGRPSTRANTDRVIVGVALDITEQRGAQARLVAAETRLHGALSSMTDSFVIWDAMKRLVLWNVRFEDFFGLKPGQLQPGMEQVSVEYMVGPAIEEVIDTNSPDGSVEIRLKDGRWIRYVETQTAEGGHVSIGTNITEIRLRESEIRENEKALKNTVGILRKSQEGIFELAQRYEEEKIRAEDANQSKSDFLANMSHELRTPLNAINGFSDIMQKEMFGPLGDPRYKEYVNDILFSGQHLLALINDILDMSKIEAGKMTLKTEIMYMHEMIHQVMRIVRGRAEEAQLNLNVTGDEVHEIEADPRAVKQVLLNLLTNAIKFTPENGTVQVDLIQKKTGIIVKVSDSGIGISQENIERLAKPFEQVVDDTSSHKEGTGLGLALSKSLVELHGGNFKIESELGHGTVVIFSLPNRPINQKEEVEDTQVTQEISKLASDIATVLAENDAQLGISDSDEQPSLPEVQPNPYEQSTEPEPEPNPYASNSRPAA